MTDSTPRVLLVEDDPVSASFLQAVLERLPAHVDAAPTCARARGLARAGDHALLLFDANLPDGRGDALLTTLRASGVSAPAIAHTASRDVEEHERLLAAGFLEVLVKPLSAAEILASARIALGLGAPPVRLTPAPSETPLWDDAAALDALLGDRGHLDALRSMFIVELRSMRAAIAAASRGGEHEAMRPVLHRLRASCGFVGATRLGGAAAALAGDASAWAAFDAVVAETLAQAPVAGD
jgi:CheY-like chemotaxis protein/HPt (histidine-containing phosphotransfer) domain-containing protein